MSYERLNLQDFKDVWTAAHISHVEDGIVNNETKLNTVESSLNTTKAQVSTNTNNISQHRSQINTLNSKVEDLYESELINSIMPLWNTLLSYGGEKIFPPTISFDGNMIGKPYLSVGGDDQASMGYVRIGDPTLPSSGMGGVMTLGGLYHLLLPAYTALGQIDYNVSINQFTGLQTIPLLAVVSGEESYDYGDNSVVIYNSNYVSQLLDLSNEGGGEVPPTAFSIDRNFEYEGIIYPSGFYSIYLFQKQFNDSPLNLPMLYVDRFWELSSFQNYQNNMSLDYSKASNAFECYEDSIYWNGIDNLHSDVIIPSDHPFACKCISYNPQAFLLACVFATKITKNGNDVSVSIQGSIEDGNIILFLDDTIVIVPTLVLDGDRDLNPGVYVLDDQPFTLSFYGMDTQKLFNKYEINHQYLPKVPEFNLSEMGMSTIPLDGSEIILATDTTKLYFCSQKGPVKLIIPTTEGEISYLANFATIGSANQNVFSGYYNGIKFDVVTIFNQNMIMVSIIPVS